MATATNKTLPKVPATERAPYVPPRTASALDRYLAAAAFTLAGRRFD